MKTIGVGLSAVYVILLLPSSQPVGCHLTSPQEFGNVPANLATKQHN
jgi:hypothetical protein